MSGGLGDAMARAHAAWSRRWAEAPAAPEPEPRRYVITIECSEEVFEDVKLLMRGYPMRRRGFREEPIGGDAR